FPTIISGAIGGAGETDNSKQLFYTANAEGVVIDGFDIRKAYNDAGGGAALVLSNGSARIKHCIIHDNYAQSGVAFSGGFVNENIYFEDCLIYDNTSANGDVMVLGATNTKAKLTNCTVASNIATGGNVFGGFTSITYTIHNSIVWNHSVDVFQFGTTVHVASCIIEESDPADYASSSDILSSNPKFTNAGTDDYTLKLGSPAHNAGDNALVATNSDLGANPRIYENTVDMGCFENQTPSVYYVDVDATGLNNGTSWVNAYTDLHEALNNAVEGQQIWVAEGIYFTSYFNDQTASFVLSHNVPVYGGFAGSETSVDERDWFANATELSGNIGSVFLSSDNAWHVVFADDPTGSFYIDGFAIRGGRADGAGVHEDIGAGVLIEFSTGTFTMNNCFLYNNVADYTGGGVTAFCSSFINNTTFYQNEAHIGGAVDWSEGLYMENCLFSENIANIGIVNHNSGGTLDMRGCTFNANSVNWSSYTIVEGGNGTVANTIIWGNTTLDANIRAVQGVDDVHHSILQGAALTAGVEGEGVLYEDPHFENAPLNLNLQYNSPAINAGDISLVTLPTDIGGGPRVKLGYVDIGALESDGIVPGVIYVDDSATGNNDGTSWANAYTSLKTAIAASDPSLQIWVAEGLYKPTTTTDRNQSFVIGEGVNLMGGFAGTETDPGQRNITAHPSILSGGIGGAGVEDNSLKVVYITDVLEPVLIDGFEITEAYGSSAEPVAMALGVDDSQVDVYNCRIYNNSARAYPALYVCNSVVNFNNCLIHDNSTSASDGIAYKSVINLACTSSVLELNNCTVTGNTIPGSSASAISVNAVSNQLIVTNSIIWGNGVPMVDDPNALTILDYCIAEGMTGTHLIDVDPDFVDGVNGDFHIQPWSAAVNTGLNSYVGLSTDLDGMERIQGGLVDLGCYEASTCSQLNDDCTGAVFLPDELAVPGSTKCASGGDSPSNPCATVTGNSVWYTFTGPESGEASLHVDYVGTFTTNFNPRLAVYTGTCGAMTYVTCSNSNGAGFGEQIDLVGLVAEAQYFVRVDAPVGQAGLFELTLDINDECTGDLDGNGAINVADLLIFNAAFGCTSGCGAADLDGNGVVNTADLLIFNALFGTLCP
ncbi:MAG: hypothetical protein JNM00_11920, partial [Flavobacteriales bacterium]|nr:hypothetical protein [Flavobacteriales bacterium]